MKRVVIYFRVFLHLHRYVQSQHKPRVLPLVATWRCQLLLATRLMSPLCLILHLLRTHRKYSTQRIQMVIFSQALNFSELNETKMLSDYSYSSNCYYLFKCSLQTTYSYSLFIGFSLRHEQSRRRGYSWSDDETMTLKCRRPSFLLI